MLPSVVDTRPPHHAGGREPVEQSKAHGHPGGASTALPTAAPVPASRRRDLGGAGPTRPAPNSLASPLVSRSRGRRLLAEADLAPVDPEPMEDGRQLARQRDLRPPHAAPLPPPHRPPIGGGEP